MHIFQPSLSIFILQIVFGFFAELGKRFVYVYDIPLFVRHVKKMGNTIVKREKLPRFHYIYTIKYFGLMLLLLVIVIKIESQNIQNVAGPVPSYLIRFL